MFVYALWCNNGRTYEQVKADVNSSKKAKRDTVRCLLLEEFWNENNAGTTIAVTVDVLDEHYREDRHISSSINSLGNEQSNALDYGKGKIKEVYVDYTWSVGGYWSQHLTPSFFNESLVYLSGLLDTYSIIVLPLVSPFLIGLLLAKTKLSNLYDISFKTADEAKTYSLICATDRMGEDSYHIFGKRPNQETISECTLQMAVQHYPSSGSESGLLYLRNFHQSRQLQNFKLIILTRKAVDSLSDCSWRPLDFHQV